MRSAVSCPTPALPPCGDARPRERSRAPRARGRDRGRSSPGRSAGVGLGGRGRGRRHRGRRGRADDLLPRRRRAGLRRGDRGRRRERRRRGLGERLGGRDRSRDRLRLGGPRRQLARGRADGSRPGPAGPDRGRPSAERATGGPASTGPEREAHHGHEKKGRCQLQKSSRAPHAASVADTRRVGAPSRSGDLSGGRADRRAVELEHALRSGSRQLRGFSPVDLDNEHDANHSSFIR